MGDDDYTAEFWEYDARIGRRWNVDPVPKVSISGYAVLGNSPIIYMDPNGDDWYKDKKGNMIFNEKMHGKRKDLEWLHSSHMERDNGHLMWYQSNGQVAELSEESVVVTASKSAQTVKNSWIFEQRTDNKQPLIQAGDSKTYIYDVTNKLSMFERWKQAKEDNRSMQKWVFGGMATVVALPVVGFAAIESGASTYVSEWIGKNGAEYTVNFGIETIKSLWANRGQVKKMDWGDIMVNTITCKSKLFGKFTAKTFNSLVDYSYDGGLKTAFSPTESRKSFGVVATDMFYNYFKIGAGEVGKAGGIGDAPRMVFDAVVDQIKATYKQINQ